MKLVLKLCTIVLCTVSALKAWPEIDLVAFSKNRPLQCYGFLESCKQYISGIHEMSVIYYADPEFELGYEEVKAHYPSVRFIQQSAMPRADFQKLTCEVVFASQAPYIIFAVDDIVAIGYADLRQCAQLMEQHDAYAFYLRLGTDISECYSEGRHSGTPQLNLVEDGVYTWKFYEGTGDWGYPHSVDMTLFRKKDIEAQLLNIVYYSPNTFEARWAASVADKIWLHGLCFTYSKIVNLPLNMVQDDFCNRHAGSCDANFLLEKFQQGLKMDIALLYQFPHKAPHAEWTPTFIPR